MVIPDAVHRELLLLKEFGYETEQLNADWILVKTITPEPTLSRHLSILDVDEIEAIILAQQLRADWLLIDEKKGRRKAEELGLRIIGLLGILVKAKQEGLIPQVKPAMDKLSSVAEFRMSQTLIDLVLRTVNEK